MSKKQNAAQPLPEEGANKTEDAQFPIVKYGKVLVFLLLVIIGKQSAVLLLDRACGDRTYNGKRNQNLGAEIV